MTILMNSSSSRSLSTYQLTRITLTSSVANITWEILKYPESLNTSTNPIIFEDTLSLSSVSITAYFTCYFSGTYVIRATERNQAPVTLYIEAKSLNDELALPFIGERLEFDSLNGWGKKINKSISSSKMAMNNSADIKAVAYDNTASVGDILSIIGAYQTTSDNIIFYGQAASVAGGVFGIIIKKYTITNDNLFGTGEVLENKTIFKVLHHGTIVLDYDIGISVDGDNKFYYSTSTNTLTNTDTDTYVGEWDAGNYVLTIENVDVFGNYIGSSGEYPVGERTVIVDANATPVTDKVFNTWGDADTYLTGMTPALATDNRWTIIMNGTISENVTIRNYVNIQGNSNNTTIQQIRGGTTSFENTLINGCVIKDIYQDDDRSGSLYFKLINCTIDCSSITILTFAKMKFISCTFLNFDIPDIAYGLENAVYLYECHIVEDGTINFPAHEGIDSIFSVNGCNFKNLMGGSIIFNGGEFYGCELPSINLTAGHVRFDQPVASSYKLYSCGIGMWTLTDANSYDITLAQCYGYGEVQIAPGFGGTATGTVYVYDVTGILVDETSLTVEYYHKNIFITRSGALTNPPTEAELASLLGTAIESGTTALAVDTTTGNVYFCTLQNYTWYYAQMTPGSV